jgi:hypothetical protein
VKFFGIFFLVITLICLFFWATDEAGSGMGWATLICAVLGGAGFVGESLRSKSLNNKAGK